MKTNLSETWAILVLSEICSVSCSQHRDQLKLKA
jgi:hypothetical protein